MPFPSVPPPPSHELHALRATNSPAKCSRGVAGCILAMLRCGPRARGKRALVALVALLLVARGGLAAAGDGTCDADAKGAIAAGKNLSDELLAMHDVESLGSVNDVLRTWRLVRNQQQHVEESFEQADLQFNSIARPRRIIFLAL